MSIFDSHPQVNVFGSFAGMLNMLLFLLLMNFLSALMVSYAHTEL